MNDKDFEELFKTRPLAHEFLVLFAEYGNLIDDTVDESHDPLREQRKAYLASKVFNCEYWRKYSSHLVLIERIINAMYFDSTKWEKTNEKWKRDFAKVDSHCGMWMIFAVILIEFGYETLMNYSLRIKEYSYERHKNDP